MSHVNTYASVTKVSIIKEDLMMMTNKSCWDDALNYVLYVPPSVERLGPTTRAVLRILGALGTNLNLKRNLIFASISQSTALHIHVCHFGKCINIEIGPKLHKHKHVTQ